jgi:UDP-galactopyranose mutase
MRVLLVERKPHIGGNAYDELDENGILVHRYGPHLFHTNDRVVFDYLSQFTAWRPYEHRALASVDGKLVPIPINRKTVNLLLGLSLATDEEVRTFFESECEPRREILNSEDVVVSKVGRRLYELLYKGYSRKQWGIDPSELAPSVCGRLPIRANLDDRYFADTYQAVPAEGYTAMFNRMLAHQHIDVMLSTDYRSLSDSHFDKLIFTGRVDEFFGNVHGVLPYRSLRFDFETQDREFAQPVAVINYTASELFTRVTEYKHITGQSHSKTTIAREYALPSGEPYYPIPRGDNAAMYSLYEAEAAQLTNVYFTGRLATYRYYNMDQVVAQSLALFAQISEGKA